jgi:hypothetical protein
VWTGVGLRVNSPECCYTQNYLNPTREITSTGADEKVMDEEQDR